jgi:enediyne biosynthesis protein E4
VAARDLIAEGFVIVACVVATHPIEYLTSFNMFSKFYNVIINLKVIIIILAISCPMSVKKTDPHAHINFTDDAVSSGLVFSHKSGASHLRQLPETMSGGVGLLDFDRDGWMDVYVVQGGTFPPTPGDAEVGDRLFRNRRDGTFEDVTVPSGISALARGYGHGVAVGDFDNDGDPDLFVSRWRSYSLYRNRGDGTFEDVTSQIGLGGDRDWPTSAAWADLDNDGDLDLYVCHYVDWDEKAPKICKEPALSFHIYCTPILLGSKQDHVFRNDGIKFTDVSVSSGIVDADGRGMGVIAADLDDDNRIDLYVANDASANYLFRNCGDLRFQEVALVAGVAGADHGSYLAGMGVSCGDLDGDGRPDLAVTNFIRESTTFYNNLGDLIFSNDTSRVGLVEPTLHTVGFGIAFLDFDNDGRLDLAIANGHVNDTRPRDLYAMRCQLFAGSADGRLVDVSDFAGPPWRVLRVGRALATGDLDNDGRVDLIVVSQNDKLAYFHNRSAGGHFVTFRLEGNQSNRDGVGAKVRVVANGRSRFFQRTGGGSYQSACDPRIHVGLGPCSVIDLVEIRWPSGRIDRHENLKADTVYMVREGDRAIPQISHFAK